MIVVAGTKRSGTSLWMQILSRGGFQTFGAKFPSNWEKSIKDANPHGFYESVFREGINWTTNPGSGSQYIRARDTQDIAVKIFMAGVVKTEAAYLDRVIVTTRHWAEYAQSIRRLYALELTHLQEHEDVPHREEKKAKIQRAIIAPVEYEWFFENYEFIRDFNLRRYPCKLAVYEHLLLDPEKTIRTVFSWLGKGDVEEAVKAVDSTLAEKKIHRPAVAHPYAEIFDEFYQALEVGKITEPLLEKLNTTAEKIRRELREKAEPSTSTIGG